MPEYRASLIEVSPEADDSLQTFRPETGNAIATRLNSIPTVRRARTADSRPGTGWREGLLLFFSGALIGVLCAFTLSLDWPASADGAVADVHPSLETAYARTRSGSASVPLPVATAGPPEYSGAVSEPNPAARREGMVAGLSASSGYRGTLRVNSQPRGASIFINERYVGRTPMVIRALPVGSRAVRLRLDGYAPWSRGVNIVANEFTTVAAKLNPAKTID